MTNNINELRIKVAIRTTQTGLENMRKIMVQEGISLQKIKWRGHHFHVSFLKLTQVLELSW